MCDGIYEFIINKELPIYSVNEDLRHLHDEITINIMKNINQNKNSQTSASQYLGL